MAWKHNGKTIQIGKAWVSDNNIKYPRQWNNLTDAEKKSAGLVWEDDPVVEVFDKRFYWAKGIEKKLEDENVVGDDGKAVIDPITGKQMIQRGLKYQWIERTKYTANNLLTVSDWYVTRKSETDTAIPSDISKYRTDVRTSTATIETKINNCKTLSDFQALFLVPKDSNGDPTGNAPIYDFPDEV